MDLTWYASSLDLSLKASSCPLPEGHAIWTVRLDDEIGLPADRDPGAAIFIEVRSSNDQERAFHFLERLRGIPPVCIYDPEVTPFSAIALIKAGAAQVATTAGELADFVNRLEAPALSNAGFRTRLVGASRSILAVAANIALVANRHCNVLIEGETGTGKEVVAREIHESGRRSRGPWVAINCGAIPEALLEAELFGHVKGAFTGAVQSRAGKFEAANHGTIFLDEIGEMPLPVQAKLLRVLQEREIERLGGNERIRLDVRVLAASNVDLAARVGEGLFREDLYYRLNVFQIVLPALRERLGDLPLLAGHLVARICASENMAPKRLDPSALQQLGRHSWPGNVRELENVLETAVILSGTRSAIYTSDLRIGRTSSRAVAPTPQQRFALPAEGLDYQQALETFELDLLTQAIARTRGNKTAAAELLRLKRTTLSARMRVLGCRLPRLVA